MASIGDHNHSVIDQNAEDPNNASFGSASPPGDWHFEWEMRLAMEGNDIDAGAPR